MANKKPIIRLNYTQIMIMNWLEVFLGKVVIWGVTIILFVILPNFYLTIKSRYEDKLMFEIYYDQRIDVLFNLNYLYYLLIMSIGVVVYLIVKRELTNTLIGIIGMLLRLFILAAFGSFILYVIFSIFSLFMSIQKWEENFSFVYLYEVPDINIKTFRWHLLGLFNDCFFLNDVLMLKVKIDREVASAVVEKTFSWVLERFPIKDQYYPLLQILDENKENVVKALMSSAKDANEIMEILLKDSAIGLKHNDEMEKILYKDLYKSKDVYYWWDMFKLFKK